MTLKSGLCVCAASLGLVLIGCNQDVGVVRNKNKEPVATIHTPTDQSVFTEGDLIDFVGTVSDEDGADTLTTVTWNSSIDFELGSPELVSPDADGFSRFRAVLSAGSHVVSLVVTDEVGAVGQDSLTVIVLSANQEPTATVLSPENFTELIFGEQLSLVGLVADEQDAVDALSVEWTAENVDTGNTTFISESPPNAAGATNATWEPDEIGNYILRLKATDLDGNIGFAEIFIVVLDPDLLDLDGDGWYSTAGDCDDSDPNTYPLANEICGDAKDNDCNGVIDDKDQDRDGHIDELCVFYVGPIPSDDCNDSDSAVYPGAVELPDGRDNTCEGEIDEGTEYYDDDGDCFCETGPCTGSIESSCIGLASGDCNDMAQEIYPMAPEVCNGLDDDCDTLFDDDDTDVDLSTGIEWFQDGDGDGYGAASIWACVQPTGTATIDGDCDDGVDTIYPGASETCNGSDDDCDGVVDEDDAIDAKTWYLDADTDGFGTIGVFALACTAPVSYVADATDCDDLDALVFPGATEVCNGIDDDCDTLVDDDDVSVDLTTAPTWFEDDDEDGFGDASDTVQTCTQPTGYVADATDCDDTDKFVYPGADEYCNSSDDDCDGIVDEDDAVDVETFYLDADKDGYGGLSLTKDACTAPLGFVDTDTDCDDLNAAVNPSATESCNGFDDDCDGDIDDLDTSLDSTTATNWYLDDDSDTYGTSSTSVLACVAPTSYVATNTDCNDSSSVIHPGATEACNSIDDDCDGDIDDDDASLDKSTGSLFYADTDADTYGDGTKGTMACIAPKNHVKNPNDCDDSRDTVYPGATESCNARDDDCDGVVDEDGAIGAVLYYFDWDKDGYGNPVVSRKACSAPSGYVSNDDDCDDSKSTVSPLATEQCNSIDDDCDGDIDDADTSVDTSSMSLFYTDSDKDGYGSTSFTKLACSAPSGFVSNADDCNDGSLAVNPGVSERCNSIDDDCDGTVDEADATDAKTYYADVDGDGYGNSSLTARGCSVPTGYSVNSSDCNDLQAAINPAADEVCNSIDDDCDGDIDDGDASLDLSTRTVWYADTDFDGFGGTTVLGTSCLPVTGSTDKSGDCNDSIAAINPAASEVCNSIDDDCDGDIDDADTSLDKTTGSVFYADADGDTFGSVADADMSCLIQAGYVTDSRDCDDSRASVNPLATEICDDGLDNDCDGSANGCRLTGDFTLNSDADVYLDGSDVADYAAQAVSRLDDWDGDGYAEILVAAPFGDDVTEANVGVVYVVGGNETSSLDLDLDAVAMIVGEDPDDYAGWGLDGGGDFDGDGTGDVIIGAFNGETATSKTNTGMAYLFHGSIAGTVSIASADVIFVGEGTNNLLGRDVAFVGDLDDDGDDELALAAPYYTAGTNTFAGRVYVVDGSSSLSGTKDADTAASTIIEGEKKNSKLGYSEFSNAVDNAGDVDGDGNDDLIVGSFGYDSAGATTILKAGRAYLFYGDLTTGTVSASTADVIVTGNNTNEYVGYSVAGVGDVDADGYADILVGADGLDSGTGAALLIYGGSTLSSSWSAASADAVLKGDDTGERAGRSVSEAGDTDGDGTADFLIGAPFNSKMSTDGGVVYIVFEAVTGTISLGSDTNVGRFYGDATQVYAGYAISGAGDYNGDGNDDLLFGMGRYGSSSGSLAGRGYLYLGLGL